MLGPASMPSRAMSVQQVAHAGACVALSQNVQGHPGVLGPAVHRQLPLALCILAGVKRNGDAFGAEFSSQPTTSSGRRTASEPTTTRPAPAWMMRATSSRPRRHRRSAPAAASAHGSTRAAAQGCSHRHAQRPDRPDASTAHPARRRPRAWQRIIAIRGFLRVVALAQPHHAAVADIQRGVDDETHAAVPSRKLRSISEPVSPERSGWNCAP